MSQGGHSEQLLFSALFYQSAPSCLKVMGGWWWWVAHVILVSALGPNPSFFLFWGTFIQLGGLLGQGPGLGLGPGLDNIVKLRSRSRSGEGQVRVRRVRRVRFGPELYPIFGLHPPTTHPPTTNFFLALKGPRHVKLTFEGLV